MSGLAESRVPLRRQRANLVCRAAFTSVGVLLVPLVLVEVLTDGSPTGALRVLELVVGWAALLGFAFGVVSAWVALVIFPGHGYWSPQDHELAAWGRRARLVSRMGMRVWWATALVMFSTLVPVLIQDYAEIGPDIWADGTAIAVLAAVAQAGIAMMVLAGLVRLAAELSYGFNGPGSSQTPPAKSGQLG